MPNRIIKETKTIIQYKFLDYFFDPIWEDIDCRTEEGQSRYREIFGHSPVKHDTNKYDVKKGDKVLLKSLNIDINNIKVIMGSYNERDRRLLAGFLSASLGVGGDNVISKITGFDVKTVCKGRNELAKPDTITKDGVRHKGSGRKTKEIVDENYKPELLRIINDDIAGDPMNDKRWIGKSLRTIRDVLLDKGINASINTIRKTLLGEKITLKKNVKTKNTRNHPQRNEQFLHLNEVKKEFLVAGKPVISIDTKKKEMIGDFKNDGRTWCKEPYETLDHDFPSLGSGKLIPFGIYDINLNKGNMYCGNSYETSEFAVDAIAKWYYEECMKEYPNQDELLILCDSGGANNYRFKLWKWSLQTKLADRFNLKVTICHYPSGCSKYNPIEHRLFSFISINWSGIPLRSYDIAIGYINSTTTKKGLTVEAQLVNKVYERGIQVTKEQMASLNIERHDICPQWNYTLRPRGSLS